MMSLTPQQLQLDEFPLDSQKKVTSCEISEIKGLHYIPNFVTQAEADFLLQQIDHQPWLSDLKRPVQHYGYKYNYQARKIDHSLYLGTLPDWLLEWVHRLNDEQFMPEKPDQVIINEYQPGQGISQHIDCVSCFTETIVSLSLGSTCIMDFINPAAKLQASIFLEPRSLLLLSQEARYQWFHRIAARKTDQFQGQRVSRSRRVSLTFRKVILAGV